MTANKKVICDILLEYAETDSALIVLCSDSRGSASMMPFATAYPNQFIEVGIAEQNLVSIAAWLAACGKKAFAVSPASFLTTRSLEQAKVDVAYSNTNVKLIGISGGISYGALGMTHHSTSDIAAMASIPNMRVYLPSDRWQTAALIRALLKDNLPAYVRVGRNAVEDVYKEECIPFKMNQATVVKDGMDLTVIACGEMVKPALDAAALLHQEGISARVLDMYCIKPIDQEAIIQAAKETKGIVTVEEHVSWGGLGSKTAQIVSESSPCPVCCLSLPDTPVITGSSKQVFDYYQLNAQGIAKAAREMLLK